MNKWSRRQVLRAAAGASLPFLCPWSAGAQTGGSLLRAPRHALVVGNAQYRQAPLANPVNDAKAMAAALGELGFEVRLGLELTRAQFEDEVRAYLAALAKHRSVGVFYFAGHGVQLAWRNYLIPVDVEIATAAHLRSRAADVNALVEGIRKAANPMNVIILDACRDNPFGEKAQTEQRGLSQLDAPPRTLLAYATAPGNVAADGEGQHSLYTEHLLREIRAPELKVEDVFKRVRLAVRRRSKGQQIPWESTSLEEDFWFVPPKDAQRLADAEAQRAFEVEHAQWEKIKGSTEPEPLEEYLRAFPSGRFSELAQLRLDQLLAKRGEKRIEIATSAENPYSMGSGRTDTAFRIGDTYAYRNLDIYTGREDKPYVFTVTAITDTEVIYNNGQATADLLGNELKTLSGPVRGPNQIIPLEFAVGKRYTTRFRVDDRGREHVVDLRLHIDSREPIEVPAGRFNAFRVKATGWGIGPATNVQWELTRWYAPDRVRRWVASEILTRGTRAGITTSRRLELVSFRQS